MLVPSRVIYSCVCSAAAEAHYRAFPGESPPTLLSRSWAPVIRGINNLKAPFAPADISSLCPRCAAHLLKHVSGSVFLGRRGPVCAQFLLLDLSKGFAHLRSLLKAKSGA